MSSKRKAKYAPIKLNKTKLNITKRRNGGQKQITKKPMSTHQRFLYFPIITYSDNVLINKNVPYCTHRMFAIVDPPVKPTRLLVSLLLCDVDKQIAKLSMITDNKIFHTDKQVHTPCSMTLYDDNQFAYYTIQTWDLIKSYFSTFQNNEITKIKHDGNKTNQCVNITKLNICDRGVPNNVLNLNCNLLDDRQMNGKKIYFSNFPFVTIYKTRLNPFRTTLKTTEELIESDRKNMIPDNSTVFEMPYVELFLPKNSTQIESGPCKIINISIDKLNKRFVLINRIKNKPMKLDDDEITKLLTILKYKYQNDINEKTFHFVATHDEDSCIISCEPFTKTIVQSAKETNTSVNPADANTSVNPADVNTSTTDPKKASCSIM